MYCAYTKVTSLPSYSGWYASVLDCKRLQAAVMFKVQYFCFQVPTLLSENSVPDVQNLVEA